MEQHSSPDHRHQASKEIVCIWCCLPTWERCCRQPAWLSHSPADDLAPCPTSQPAAGLGQHDHLGVRAQPWLLKDHSACKKKRGGGHAVAQLSSAPLPSSLKSLKLITTSPGWKCSVFVLGPTLEAQYYHQGFSSITKTKNNWTRHEFLVLDKSENPYREKEAFPLAWTQIMLRILLSKREG